MGVDLFVASRQFVCNQSENSIKLSRAGLYFRYNNIDMYIQHDFGFGVLSFDAQH